MSDKIKILRQFAKMRKLFPSVLHLGIVNEKTVNELLRLAKDTPISNDRAINLRSGIYGVEHDNTSPVGKTYNIKYIDDFIVDIEVLNIFKNKTEWRFADLDAYSSIPRHLDNPYTYRFLVLLQGSHKFETEIETIIMTASNIYFINSAYRHAVYNITDKKRVVLLGKMEINEHNTRLLRTRTGK